MSRTIVGKVAFDKVTEKLVRISKFTQYGLELENLDGTDAGFVSHQLKHSTISRKLALLNLDNETPIVSVNDVIGYELNNNVYIARITKINYKDSLIEIDVLTDDKIHNKLSIKDNFLKKVVVIKNNEFIDVEAAVCLFNINKLL